MNIDLTEQEIAIVRQCIDVAVKQADRQSVRVLVAIDIKIESQLSNAAKPTESK